MNDEIEIIIHVGIGLSGCKRERTVTMSRQDWEGMDEDERDKCCEEQMFELIEWHYEVQG